MSRKQNKVAKRKAKLKARKFHAEQHRLYQSGRIADALMDLCADVLPEYVDDFRGIDLVGRNILWRMGMVAWNIAVTGRREIDESSINTMKLDEESRRMVRDEVNALVRLKYKKYPDLRTSISNVSAVNAAGVAKLKVVLGDTFPAVSIPDFTDESGLLTPEQLLAKRKALGLSQVKFAAALNVSVKKVSAWEHGKVEPSEDEIEKIAALFRKKVCCNK